MSNEPASAKIPLHRLPLYNPSRLKDSEIIAAFVTREPLLQRIVADIKAEKPRSRAQHHLIVGQRGMGKTLLLARIAAEVRTTALNDRLIPLVFAEEQYAVDRLSKFWLNCLDSLADEHDRAGNEAAVREIDDTVRGLTPLMSGTSGDKELSRKALDAFLASAATTGKRPILLVDNLQIVFERITPDEQHTLREVLMRPGCPVLIGASPSQPAATEDYGAAFYDHFKNHYLRPLTAEEMQSLMLHLADAVERPEVRTRVTQHPERLPVLRQLTGGNPRTTATLFFLYAEDFAPDVFGDLENLLDRVTPLFKAIFEELSPQQQVLASAIANHWDPITTRELAKISGLAASKISPQLERLEKAGFVEKVDLFDNANTGYQIAERFFNVWFLMRSASRRQRREVEFLTRFLQTIYEAPERDRLARHLMNECNLSADRHLLTRAVAASLEQGSTREDLLRFADLDVLRQQNRVARRALTDILDLSALPPATLEFAALRDKLKALVPPDAPVTPDEFVDKVLGDRQMFHDGQRERLATRGVSLTAKDIKNALVVINKTRKSDIKRFSFEAVEWFSNRLTSGQLRSVHDVEDWNRAFQTAEGREHIDVLLQTLPYDFGNNISPETLEIIYSYFDPNQEDTALDWHIWAHSLDLCHRYEEAEAAYREAIKRDREHAESWYFLGLLLQYRLGRYVDAEAAYRELIKCEPENALSWSTLGDLLHFSLERHDEAESVYREAIRIDPNETYAWTGLGILLSRNMQRRDEAEAAYHKAIECSPNDARVWTELGNLLAEQPQRFDEAEAAYRKAIEYDPASAYAWISLGNLLLRDSNRHVEAEQAYREGIKFDPEEVYAWFQLGNLLAENLHRYAEAAAAYREAIKCDPNDADLWSTLGNLLCDHLHRFTEASNAFEKSLEINSRSEIALNNALFLHRDFLGEGSLARPRMDQLSALLEIGYEDSLFLHHALFNAYECNWRLATEALTQALVAAGNGFPSATTDDWMRAGAVLLHLNQGESLVAFLEDQGASVRLRPWYEALKALQRGDSRYLLNIAPEVRGAAERFYEQMESRLKNLPDSTRRRPLPAKPKRATKSKTK